jgi:DNA polymerase-3 subunit delta
MNFEDLGKELSKGKLRSAYLLAGPESLLQDESLAFIRSAVLADGPSDFNFDQFEGRSAEPSALIDAIHSLPMMAEHRLVLLREPLARRGGASEKLTTAIALAVAKVSEMSLSTVFVVQCSKIDRRAKWVKAFSGDAAVVDCAPPKGTRSIAAFVRSEAKRQKVKLENEVPECLAELVGPQLMLLRQEIAKLSLLVEGNEKITRAQVLESVSNVSEQPIWDLTDAIGEGRSGRALEILVRMQAAGAPAQPLLGSLATHFRKLLRVRAGEQLGGPPFVVKKLGSQARRYPPARLLACLRAIHETDEILKGRGGIRPEIAMERLVMGLAV